MYWTEFLTIAIAHLFAVASPGPDFAVVTRQSVTGGTTAGLWTSFGVGTGIFLHVGYCILGVALVISQFPALFGALKYVAAAYLLYLGVHSIRKTLRAADQSATAAVDVSVQPGRAFVLGFLTNGLNPKATLFFLALFTVVIDASTPLAIQLVYGVYLAIATFAWFAMLSSILGRRRVRDWILKAGVWFERAMGIILILLAVQIAVNT